MSDLKNRLLNVMAQFDLRPPQMAAALGVSVRTLEGYIAGRRASGAVLRLLKHIEHGELPVYPGYHHKSKSYAISEKALDDEVSDV